MAYLLIFLPIIISVILFIVSLVLFIKGKGQPELRKGRKIFFIVSSILLGVVIAVYIGIMILFSIAIRNM